MSDDVARTARARAIKDYAIIGDGRSAALIASDGTLEWLCWPSFESPSLFAALLDSERGGCFSLQPSGTFRCERAYVDETNVLQTTFYTDDGGVLRLTDAMPVASEREKRRGGPWPEHWILRRVECLAGEVELAWRFDLQPDYGRQRPHVRHCNALGIAFEFGAHVCILRSDLPLRMPPKGETVVAGTTTLTAGEQGDVALVYAHRHPAAIPSLGERATATLERTLRWWQDFSSACGYHGPYRREVVRSALALRLLTYAPSGAIIAAPTTSLPEALGGVRNWDYRYCWLRDAALTLTALYAMGNVDEAGAFFHWLMHSTQLTRPRLQVLYNVYGEAHVPEAPVEHLRGFADSRPVRVGNAAHDQFQLDVYGVVVEAAYQFVQQGGRLDRATGRMLVGFGKTVCRCWQEPDDGIWEIRSDRQHHTYSKVLAWAALDRLLRLHEQGHVRAPVGRFNAQREAIRAAVETRGYNEQLGSYVATFDGETLDASLLELWRYGYVRADAPRMIATRKRIYEHLGRDGMLDRYPASVDDGLPPGEGAFGICSFWGVSCLAAQGEVAEATRLFEGLLAHANEVGLYAEELDPTSGAHLGNFPQAFTHLGLIDAALALRNAQGEGAGG